MSEHPKPSIAPLSIKEYMAIQREAGSCMPQFKESVTKSSKFGLYAGIPFGIYCGYRLHPHSPKLMLAKGIMTLFSTVLTFSGLGVIIASYNCLRVKK